MVVPMRDYIVTSCVACGERHHTIIEVYDCLRNFVLAVRASEKQLLELKFKAAEYDRIRRLTVEYYALRSSRNDESRQDVQLTAQAKALMGKA
jgi:hypothetical protein